MKYNQLFELASDELSKNDFGVDHTLRVLDVAKKNYEKYNLDFSWKDTVFSLIVLHDIGGSDVKDQYEKGPKIAKRLMKKLKYSEFDINLVTKFISSHHERLDDPHDVFKILFDSDKFVMFSVEEFNYYDKMNLDWKKIVDSFYNNKIKNEAKKLLRQRRKKNGKKTDN